MSINNLLTRCTSILQSVDCVASAVVQSNRRDIEGQCAEIRIDPASGRATIPPEVTAIIARLGLAVREVAPRPQNYLRCTVVPCDTPRKPTPTPEEAASNHPAGTPEHITHPELLCTPATTVTPTSGETTGSLEVAHDSTGRPTINCHIKTSEVTATADLRPTESWKVANALTTAALRVTTSNTRPIGNHLCCSTDTNAEPSEAPNSNQSPTNRDSTGDDHNA